MNLKTLSIFIHLCDSRSFQKSALAMHMSPSALSRQVQKLEEQVGQALFIRDNRSVELTNAGSKLLPVALKIVSEWQQYLAELNQDTRILTGEVRFFCSVTASYTYLPALLSEFRLHQPLIEYKLSTGDPAQAIEKVMSDDVDLALSAMPDSLPPKLEFKVIAEMPFSIIAPGGVSNFGEELQKDKPNWTQVPFIIPEAGAARERANSWFKQMKFKPKIYAQVAGHEAIVSMVALGCGVGIVPDIVVSNSPVKDNIQRLKVEPIKPFKLGLCCQRANLSDPLIQALWKIGSNSVMFAS
ncbi:HTH-type transcriptional activator IlvY [Vibrio sp. S4M6]|uniref:HTH-type transcriptional activator IlvY n=1 Tax=Vibrio sinus TaxID=2946865 RepID=UPI002029E0A7|nr:HTH-type transcriptional activator IlvY [Vibrio sinus]MCL9782891.1 HTH-type transcriptional activator IlvY [Vibrio sinus]